MGYFCLGKYSNFLLWVSTQYLSTSYLVLHNMSRWTANGRSCCSWPASR